MKESELLYRAFHIASSIALFNPISHRQAIYAFHLAKLIIEKGEKATLQEISKVLAEATKEDKNEPRIVD